MPTAIAAAEVHAAAERLAAAGQSVTLAALRAELGRGSFSTLAPMLRDWREQRTPDPAADAAPMPAGAVAALAVPLWRFACERADAALAAERAQLACERADVAALGSEADARAERAEAEAVRLRTDLATARAEADALRQLLAGAETARVAALAVAAERERRADLAETALERVHAALERAQDLAQQLRAAAHAAPKATAAATRRERRPAATQVADTTHTPQEAA